MVLLAVAIVAITTGGPRTALAASEGVLPETITVLGSGQVVVTPDQAILSMGAQATAASATEALSSVSAKTANLVASLKASGIAEEDIATSGLSVYPRHNRRLQTKTYSASTQVRVTVRDITAVGPVIDGAAKAAGNSLEINGLEVLIAYPEKSLGEARQNALDNAEKRATEYAAGLGRSLGKVVQVSEEGTSNPVSYDADFEAADRASAGSFVVEPGSQELSARITVVYTLG